MFVWEKGSFNHWLKKHAKTAYLSCIADIKRQETKMLSLKEKEWDSHSWCSRQ
jgi:hypothetical protein